MAGEMQGVVPGMARDGGGSGALKDGIDPVKHREDLTSHFTGVSRDKITNKWKAQCQRTYLGHHATEKAAALAYSVEAARVGLTLNAIPPAGEKAAARAYSKSLEDGIVPGRAASSQFTGVSWHKTKNRWMAECKGKKLGRHATENAAARAYNVEAERVGRPLNIIMPAGAASAGGGLDAGLDAGAGVGGGAGVGAGSGAAPKRASPKALATPAMNKTTKRAAPTTPAAPSSSKKMKL